jgi:predicted alpha/beta hydrolase
MAFLKMSADAFIMLMQMTVLSRTTVSLVTGLGGLFFYQAAALPRKCGLLFLLLWAVGLVIVLVMRQAFPKRMIRTSCLWPQSNVRQFPSWTRGSRSLCANRVSLVL